MSDYYELIGQTAVPVHGDVLEWAQKFETMDRRVAETRLFGICDVSTVFLGLDYSWGGGPPLLFETMAFWYCEGGYEQERCSTWLEAQEQHARMCAEVVRPAAVAAYIGRCLTESWDHAKRDLRDRWREMRGIEPTEMEKTMLAIEARTFDRREDW
jgi:hypothetical protein